MKFSMAIVLLSLAAGCGNPHLKSDGVDNLPFIGNGGLLGDDFKALGLLTSDGESTANTVIKDTTQGLLPKVVVTNTNSQEYEVNYRFLNGNHFEFNGGTFPGINGTCDSDISTNSNCELDIIFKADNDGIYQDKLVVEYKPKNSNLTPKIIEFDLTGEKRSTPATLPSLKMTTLTGEEKLNFGKSLANEVQKARILLTNDGESAIKIKTSLEEAKNFKIDPSYNGSDKCTSLLKPTQSCTLGVQFIATEPGLYSDNIVTLFYKVGSSDELSKVKMPVYGEKIKEIAVPGELVVVDLEGNVIDFKTVSAGSSASKQIIIKNIGTEAVKISEINFSGDKEFNFTKEQYPGVKGTCGEIIQPGTCILDLEFNPQELGTKEAKLNIKTSNNKELTVKMIGEGIEKQACYKEEEVKVQPLLKSQSTKLELPYLPKANGTSATLTTLYGLEVNGYYKPLDMYTVKDAQVVVQYSMPKMSGEITAISMNVNVRKIVLDNYKDTESLCISTSSGLKKCSGKEFTAENFKALKNPKFWNEYSTTVNTKYMDEFQEGQSSCGNQSCFSLKRSFRMNKLFELNKEEMNKAFGKGNVSVVFTDDTRLISLPELIVKTKKQVECK